jgi:translation initiation factor 2B subunit (eIF-2B alpha/beta/delta family)
VKSVAERIAETEKMAASLDQIMNSYDYLVPANYQKLDDVEDKTLTTEERLKRLADALKSLEIRLKVQCSGHFENYF